MLEKFNIFVPMKRRLEILTLHIYVYWIIFGWIFCYLILIAGFIYGPLIIKSIIVIYLVYAYYFDKDTPNNGWNRQGSKWVRDWNFWGKFRDYFPIKLIKTADLPPTKNYLFACYPHGFLVYGLFLSFSTNALNFNKLFPGIRSKILSMSFHYKQPLYRELWLAWGFLPAFYMGRGLFQIFWGLIPRSVPLVTVIGAPIHVEKNENPTMKEIDKLHAKFTEKLILLFETHKSKYVVDSDDIHLIIE